MSERGRGEEASEGTIDLLVDFLADSPLIPVLSGLVVLWVFFASQSDVFLSPRNISNILIQSVVLSLLALAVSFVLLVAEIDLSVALISGVTSVLMANLLIKFGQSVPVAVIGAILFGMAIGFVNGYITLRLMIPSFIVTLGIALILGGIQLDLLPDTGRYNLLDTPITEPASATIGGVAAWVVFLLIGAGILLMKYQEYREIDDPEAAWYKSRVVVPPVLGYLVLGGIGVFVLESHRGIPLPLVLTLLLFGISDYVLTQTKFGVHIYAVGGNIEAAKRAGINISRLKLTLFVIAGGISAIAGIMAASRALAVSQASGGGIGGGALLLQGIAAPVIGGISLFGGRGQVSGAFLGALIIGTVSNGLNLMGIASELRLVVTGGLLISAVGIDKSIQRLTEP